MNLGKRFVSTIVTSPTAAHSQLGFLSTHHFLYSNTGYVPMDAEAEMRTAVYRELFKQAVPVLRIVRSEPLGPETIMNTAE